MGGGISGSSYNTTGSNTQKVTPFLTFNLFEMRKYFVDIIQYGSNNTIVSNCNSISFVNTGTVNAEVNKYILIPGASLTITGNADEIDTTNYQISFTGGTGILTVIRKHYK